MDNYRPISVLPTVSKIIEKIIHARFSKYLTSHHLLTPYQSGFRKFHSAETAVLSLTDTICKNVDLAMLTSQAPTQVFRGRGGVHFKLERTSCQQSLNNTEGAPFSTEKRNILL